MLKTLQARFQQYVNHELQDVQAGFRKGRGTRGQIANILWIIQKAREFQKNIYFRFINCTKAFDCVDHNKLWKTLKEMGIPYHLIFSSVQFSCSVVSNSLRPHESQHARPPYPSSTPRVYPNSCPSSQWCHPAISSSTLSYLLRNLYAGQEATVRTGHGTTDWFQIGKAVRQGCILSPCLFNLYKEYIMRHDGWMK